MMRTVTAFVLFVIIGFLAISAAKADEPNIRNQEKRFTIVKGENIGVCKDIQNILNDPINDDFSVYQTRNERSQGTDFKIPQEYEYKYLRPTWTDIPMKDLETSELYFANSDLEELKKLYSQTGEYKVQRSNPPLDFDNEWQETGNSTIYRYLPSKKAAWRCTVPETQPYLVAFNKADVRDSCSFLISDGLSLALSLRTEEKTPIIYVSEIKASIKNNRTNESDYLDLNIRNVCSFSELTIMGDK